MLARAVEKQKRDIAGSSWWNLGGWLGGDGPSVDHLELKVDSKLGRGEKYAYPLCFVSVFSLQDLLLGSYPYPLDASTSLRSLHKGERLHFLVLFLQIRAANLALENSPSQTLLPKILLQPLAFLLNLRLALWRTHMHSPHHIYATDKPVRHHM